MADINWTSGLLQGYNIYDQLDRFNKIGEKAVEGTTALAQEALSGTQFKPYGVTTNTGTASVQGNNLNLQLSPEEQARVDALQSQYGGLFAQAAAPTGQREADVYDRIRATQIPEEQRAGYAMNDRLLAQGRAGIQSDAYGGTPEQLAYHKAVQESQNNASLMALQQAKGEQMQNAQLGGMFQNASYLPQSQLLNAYNPAINLANMGQAGQIAGTNTASQLQLGGLQMGLNSDVARAKMMSDMYSQAAMGAANGGFDPIGNGIDWLSGLFGF